MSFFSSFETPYFYSHTQFSNPEDYKYLRRWGDIQVGFEFAWALKIPHLFSHSTTVLYFIIIQCSINTAVELIWVSQQYGTVPCRSLWKVLARTNILVIAGMQWTCQRHIPKG